MVNLQLSLEKYLIILKGKKPIMPWNYCTQHKISTPLLWFWKPSKEAMSAKK